MKELEIINRNIEDIIPYENNPRINETSVDTVADSIQNFGFRVPIIVDGKGVLIAGHTRILAAKKLGLKEVPCIVAEDLTEDQVKAFRLADNRVSEYTKWDDEKLAKELQALGLKFDLSKLSFTEQELKRLNNLSDSIADEEGEDDNDGLITDDDEFSDEYKKAIITYQNKEEAALLKKILGLPEDKDLPETYYIEDYTGIME